MRKVSVSSLASGLYFLISPPEAPMASSIDVNKRLLIFSSYPPRGRTIVGLAVTFIFEGRTKFEQEATSKKLKISKVDETTCFLMDILLPDCTINVHLI
jgi:hypothetical protein